MTYYFLEANAICQANKKRKCWLLFFLYNKYLNASVCALLHFVEAAEEKLLILSTCKKAFAPFTYLSGLPGTCNRKRHLLALWIWSSLMRISLCSAKDQSCATVVFRFYKHREKKDNCDPSIHRCALRPWFHIGHQMVTQHIHIHIVFLFLLCFGYPNYSLYDYTNVSQMCSPTLYLN